MSLTISIKKFREAVDQIKDERDSTIIKTAYLLASRNCEILTKVNPSELLSNASKPYGNFLDYTFADYEISPATKDREAITEKVLVIKCAVAKRGKTMKQPKQEMTTEVTDEEIVEALTKFKQMKLLKEWKDGNIDIDPLLVKVLLGKIYMKYVALPTSLKFEPWTKSILKWILKHHSLGFNFTRHWFTEILRRNLSGILPKKSKTTPKNLLRHFRISHLISYYEFQPYEITSYIGWKIGSTFAHLGIPASANLDYYAHLQWRTYFPKLLKPINSFKD